tara:strand:- start:1998 stop:2768 length:771 start_codon:yes stop_codon:yes gene_type:complete
MKRLHIVGCPRSGTSLLMELIATCYRNNGFCEHEMSIFEPVPQVVDLYISKQPSDIKHIEHIFFDDPKLFIIYLSRDPRSVITSKHEDNSKQYFCNYRIWKNCDNAAQHYQGHSRFLSLKYEDLVGKPDKCQNKISKHFTFLLEKHLFSKFEQFASPSIQAARAMNGLRAINTKSIDRWQQHLPRLKEQIENNSTLSKDIKRLGYETNDDWMHILDTINSEKLPCRYPDRASFFKDLEKYFRIWIKSKKYRKNINR